MISKISFNAPIIKRFTDKKIPVYDGYVFIEHQENIKQAELLYLALNNDINCNFLIHKFSDEFELYSNFYMTPILYQGMVFKSSEHAFQAQKAISPIDFSAICNAETPGKAKRIGRKIPMKDEWDEIKLGIMKEIVRSKFENTVSFRSALTSWYNTKFIEGNYWHDNFFGNCFCEKCIMIQGQNHLGKILTELSVELK